VRVIILGRLLPLGLGESGLPGPDLLLAVTFAWLCGNPPWCRWSPS
jgi:hypothetical protein